MKRSFDLDKAMEVSNVSEWEDNDIILKACGKSIKITFSKSQLKSPIPTFRVRSDSYQDDLAVDVFGYNGEMLALEPGFARSVLVGFVSEKKQQEEEQKSAACACGNAHCHGGVVWNAGAFWRCPKCSKFETDAAAREFVKKVFQTVIRNGGGDCDDE